MKSLVEVILEDSLDDIIDNQSKFDGVSFKRYIPDSYNKCAYMFFAPGKYSGFYGKVMYNENGAYYDPIQGDWGNKYFPELKTLNDVEKYFDKYGKKSGYILVIPKQPGGMSYCNQDGEYFTKEQWIKFVKDNKIK